MNEGTRFVWFELMTTDPPAAIPFYTSVFGWGTQSMPTGGGEPYTLWTRAQKPIGGMMRQAAEAVAQGAPPHWLGYVGAADVAATHSEALAHGARSFVPPGDIPEVGTFAILGDPQGAVFALFAPKQPAPADGGTPPDVITWHELATSDVEAALRFYGTIFGWRESHRHEMGEAGQYVLIGSDPARPFGGVYAMPGRAAWLYYFHVDDLDETAARVRTHHGQVLRGPMEVPGGDRIVMCVDPQGAHFALHATRQ